MFFEEIQILGVLKCANCFNKYDEPKILPCGYTLCNVCIDSIEKNIKNNGDEFNCNLCNENHILPKNGFPLNKTLMELLKRQPNEVFRSKLVESFKMNLKEIDAKRRELEFSLFNSVDKVKEYCLKFRGEIDLAAEKALQKINQTRDSMLKEVNEYEQNTIEAIEINLLNKENFKNSIEELKKFFTESGDYLKKLQIDEDEVKLFFLLVEFKLKKLPVLNNIIF